MEKQSSLITVWVKKDDPECKLFISKDYVKILSKLEDDFPIIKGTLNIWEKRRKPSDSYFYHFRLALHYEYDIETFDVHNPDVDFFQGHLGRYYSDGHIESTEFSPIIHLLEKDAGIFLSDPDLYTQKHPDAPRFRYIIDSGIWNYFSSSADDFSKDVKDVVKNWKAGYYDLLIAQEYADLNARLTKASYLYERKDSKGHGAEVSPFLFHSETLSKNRIDTQKVSKYNWRFLLLDDKIDENKENEKGERIGILTSSDPNATITKTDILQERINAIEGLKCETILASKIDDYQLSNPAKGSGIIQIICVETIDQALEWMKRYEFDIILLDYLLQNKNYGYELLTEIRSRYKGKGKEFTYGEGVSIQEKKKIIIGPHKKLFFMFISAFTTAVNERLTSEGLSRNEDYWLIGEGACPTNTPELFKYRLTHLMERRLDQTGIQELAESSFLRTVMDIYESNKDKLPNQKWIESVRERAYDNYHKILGFHYDYSILRKNDRDNSLLVKSFLEKHAHLGAMLEHLLQLVHLTAFGTVRQWPEIWEEYKFFARTITAEDTLLSEISDMIESYIIALKSE